MTNIGKPKRIVEIPDPIVVPDYPPDEPLVEPERQNPTREPVPAEP